MSRAEKRAAERAALLARVDSLASQGKTVTQSGERVPLSSLEPGRSWTQYQDDGVTVLRRGVLIQNGVGSATITITEGANLFSEGRRGPVAASMLVVAD